MKESTVPFFANSKTVVETNSPEKVLTLAEHIEKISNATEALLNSGLNEKALVVLIADSSKLSKRDVRAVLESLKTLKETFLCPKS